MKLDIKKLNIRKVSFDKCCVGDTFIDFKNYHTCVVIKKSETFFYKLPYVKLIVISDKYNDEGNHWEEIIYKHNWDDEMKSDYKIMKYERRD